MSYAKSEPAINGKPVQHSSLLDSVRRRLEADVFRAKWLVRHPNTLEIREIEARLVAAGHAQISSRMTDLAGLGRVKYEVFAKAMSGTRKLGADFIALMIWLGVTYQVKEAREWCLALAGVIAESFGHQLRPIAAGEETVSEIAGQTVQRAAAVCAGLMVDQQDGLLDPEEATRRLPEARAIVAAGAQLVEKLVATAAAGSKPRVWPPKGGTAA